MCSSILRSLRLGIIEELAMRRHLQRYFNKLYAIPALVFILCLIALMVWMLNPPTSVRTSPVTSDQPSPR
jgi:hypothetical protein